MRNQNRDKQTVQEEALNVSESKNKNKKTLLIKMRTREDYWDD